MDMAVWTFLALVVGSYIFVALSIIAFNPRVLTEPPTRDSAYEIVDRRASESITIFSIVIAVLAITAVGEQDTPLSNASLSLSATFLILGFFLREVANLAIILYELQDEAVRFGAVLLFLSLYYYAEENATESVLPDVLFVGVILSILYLLLVTVVFLYVQKQEWDERPEQEQNRRDWVRNLL